MISLCLLFLGLLIQPWALVLVLLVAFGGPLLRRLDESKSSPLSRLRRIEWVALALGLAVVLLAFNRSGGLGALILALIPVAWVLINDASLLKSEGGGRATSKNEDRSKERGKSIGTSDKPASEPDASSKDQITPLTGLDLLGKIKSFGDAPKSDLVKACGYVSRQNDGTEKLNFTAFYEALLEAKGVTLSAPAEDLADSTEEKQPGQLQDASIIAKRVIHSLDKIIDDNIDDFESGGSYKVRPSYGYEKFYLDSVEGSYDMSLQGLIHYILHEEGIYKQFLTSAQLRAVDKCIEDYPEAIYGVDTSEENGEEVESLLDNVYYTCICHVAKRLRSAGLDIDAFDDYSIVDDEFSDELPDEALTKEASIDELVNETSTELSIRSAKGPFGLTAKETTIDGPDDDGDLNVEVNARLSNQGSKEIELVLSKLYVFNGEGLPVSESEDESEDLIGPGESMELRIRSGYFKSTALSDMGKKKIQLLLHLTPCGCLFSELPEIMVPDGGNIDGPPNLITIADGITVQGLSLMTCPPDDDGETTLYLKAILANESNRSLVRAELVSKVIDASGREIDSSRWQEPVPAGSSISVEDSYWGIKASKLAGARLVVNLKAYEALGTQELSWPASSVPEPLQPELGTCIESQATKNNEVTGDQANRLPEKKIDSIPTTVFESVVNSATYQAVDEDGETRYSTEFTAINRSPKPVELILSRLMVLHPAGLLVASTEDETEDLAENGESINVSISTWGTQVNELDGNPKLANLLIHTTACSCTFKEIGLISVPDPGLINSLTPDCGSSAELSIDNVSIRTEDPDDGECRVQIKAIVRNNTNLPVPRCILETKLLGANGRELDSTSSQDEIAAHSTALIEDSFWGVKENRLNGAQLQLSIKAFTALGSQTMTVNNLTQEVD